MKVCLDQAYLQWPAIYSNRDVKEYWVKKRNISSTDYRHPMKA